MKSTIAFALAILLFFSCGTFAPFLSNSVPAAPDYSNNVNWAALPSIVDAADRTPGKDFEDLQASSQVDVFFLHPTLFLDNAEKEWNASLDDRKLNQKVDESTILYQASAFNGAGRVFAPRYRQAHYRSFFDEDKASSKKALDLAYRDLKAAFEYYLLHYNQNRPIILAAHSQGTLHAIRLLKEFFDSKPMLNRLVVAYLVGWPIPKNTFASILPCESPDQTGCFCSWRSYRYGHMPQGVLLGDSIAVTNPLTWRMDGAAAPALLNEGMIARDFNEVLLHRADAQAVNGVLWVHKPEFPGSFFFRNKNYHIADYNLFYVNIRKNAQHRVDLFWKR